MAENELNWWKLVWNIQNKGEWGVVRIGNSTWPTCVSNLPRFRKVRGICDVSLSIILQIRNMPFAPRMARLVFSSWYRNRGEWHLPSASIGVRDWPLSRRCLAFAGLTLSLHVGLTRTIQGIVLKMGYWKNVVHLVILGRTTDRSGVCCWVTSKEFFAAPGLRDVYPFY